MKRTIHEKIKLIQDGFLTLKSEKNYSQSKVVLKLCQINCKISKAAFNRVIGSKLEYLTQPLVDKVFTGFSELMQLELCYKLVYNKGWELIEDCTPQEIILEEKDPLRRGFQIYPEGRLDISQKVDFFSSAEKEVIEFGVSLNSFTNYLNNRTPTKFKNPIINLLKRNIAVKCYLLDPEWVGTSMYFDDRKSVLKEGMTGIEKIKASLRRLKIFYSEIQSHNYSKNFTVYTYRHLPTNYFMTIDKDESTLAKMMISNYLFGEKRAYCPVLEFSRKSQPSLFIRYNESLQKIIKDAKRVSFEDISD